ncbi:MAG: TRAP transporter substrate-binding protein [Gammaproteobacteria bacterium]|nr:TRAP transporter substrate-binding protein [Gammaproteobacteria bacterium]
MTRKYHRILIGLLLPWLFGLAACGGSDGGAQIVTIGGTAAPNTPGEQIWLNFARDAEAGSDGRLEIRPLIYGQLGSEEQLLSGLRRGRIQFANLSAQVASTLVPELSLLYAPFLFDDEAEADFVYDRYLTDIYTELLAENGMHLVTWYEIGFHSVYARNDPILLPEDAAGRRFRVSAAINARLFAEAIGADVIPLGYGEIVPSLQTGLIDAGENSISLFARTGISAEAPHFTLTRHAFGVSVIVADKRWWDGLPADLRQLVEDSFPSIDESRQVTRAQDIEDLADATLGIQVHPLTDAQRQQWMSATAGVTAQLLDMIGGRGREVYDLILAGKTAYTTE